MGVNRPCVLKRHIEIPVEADAMSSDTVPKGKHVKIKNNCVLHLVLHLAVMYFLCYKYTLPAVSTVLNVLVT